MARVEMKVEKEGGEDNNNNDNEGGGEVDGGVYHVGVKGIGE
jgi:hypothetical protein